MGSRIVAVGFGGGGVLAGLVGADVVVVEVVVGVRVGFGLGGRFVRRRSLGRSGRRGS